MAEKKEKQYVSDNAQLMAEWDWERNADISPSQISLGSGKKVWWKCNKGHRWLTKINHRYASKSNCPYCAGQRAISGENDLATVAPDICSEWDYEKNFPLLPTECLPKSEKKVWWTGKCGHSWKTQISLRVNGSGCPYCSNHKVLSGFNDLASVNPELLEEWDYNLNVILPTEVSHLSNKKVWWKCKAGHSWIATIASKSSGGKCPICSGKKVLVGFNDLKTTFPKLCVEWHYEKNGVLTPEMYTKGSSVRVWWKCKNNHEWEATISNRTSGRGCPVCSRNWVKTNVNDFATKHPELLLEWDFSQNIDIDPHSVASSSTQKVWWKCNYQHVWKASIYSRVLGSDCPICAIRQRTSFPEQAIFYYTSIEYPDAINGYSEIFGEADFRELDIFIPSINVAIEYDGKAWHSSDISFRKEVEKYYSCKKHDIKLIRIKEQEDPRDADTCDIVIYIDYSANYQDLNRVMTELGMYINVPDDIDVIRDRDIIRNRYWGILSKGSIKETNPELANEWNYKKNGLLLPEMVMYGSSEKVWWICKNGHEWNAAVNSRVHGVGCPYCSNKRVLQGYNDLQATHPQLVDEWDFDLNEITPDQITYGYSGKIWWKCKEGHQWEAQPYTRAKGSGCPYCSGKKLLQGVNDLQTTNPQLCSEWDYEKNGELIPTMITGKNGKKVWWKCSEGHSWQASIKHRAYGTRCPICAGKTIIAGYNDLLTLYPKLCLEWNYEKNIDIHPSFLRPRSDRKVWWKCQQGHEWEASVSNRVSGTGCPFCAKEKRKK